MNFDTPVATLVLMVLGTMGGLALAGLGLLSAHEADKAGYGWHALLIPAGAFAALSSICWGMWRIFG